MTTKIAQAIAAHSQPELARKPGMVYQVWEDGEVTCQKSGELLWLRSLHCFDAGRPDKAVSPDMFPHQLNNHGYIYTDREGAYAVRAAILS